MEPRANPSDVEQIPAWLDHCDDIDAIGVSKRNYDLFTVLILSIVGFNIPFKRALEDPSLWL